MSHSSIHNDDIYEESWNFLLNTILMFSIIAIDINSNLPIMFDNVTKSSNSTMTMRHISI